MFIRSSSCSFLIPLLIVALANLRFHACQQCNAPEFDIDYKGDDLQQSSVPRFEDCCNVCHANAQCVYWTFVRTSNLCYLKAAQSNAQRIPASGRISGSKQTVIVPTSSSSALLNMQGRVVILAATLLLPVVLAF